MSNLSRWNARYANISEPSPYGDTTTYAMGSKFLRHCKTVEDWGCGRGWFRSYVEAGTSYVGLDGSLSPFADRIVELATYRSSTEGLFMRHVLEHDYQWRSILANAVASFTRRMALVLFTPLMDEEAELATCPQVGVPDLALPGREIMKILHDCRVTVVEVETDTHYGTETVILATKEDDGSDAVVR